MKYSNEKIEEAQTAINSLEKTKSATIKSLRPSLWLNSIMSLLFGVITISFAFSHQSDSWLLVKFITAFLIVLASAFYYYRLFSYGIKPRIIPLTLTGKLLELAKIIFFATIIIGGKELYINGIHWAPYAAAVIFSTGFSYLTHHSPAGEWISKKKFK